MFYILKTNTYRVILVAVLAACSVARAGDGVHLFFQSPGVHPKLGSWLTVDAGSYDDVEQMPHVLNSFKSPTGKDLAPLNEAVEVVVVVPKGAPPEEVERYSQKVMRVLKDQLDDRARYRLVYSYVDGKKTEEEIARARETVASSVAHTEEQKRVQKDLLELYDETAQGHRDWRDTWLGKKVAWLNRRDPTHRTYVARTVAFLKGGLALKVTLTRYGVNLASVPIALANAAVTAAFGYNATEFSQWTTHHKLPFTRRHPWLEKFRPIGFYNNSPATKSIAVNTFRSLGLSYLFRGLAYMNGQRLVTKPGQPYVESPNTFPFWRDALAISGIEIVMDAGMDVGFRALEQKNYFSYMSRSYLLWLIGLIDTGMHTSFRAGDTQTAYTICALNSCFKGAVFAFGKLMPRQARRIVIVNDSIERSSDKESDFQYVVKQQNLGEAWKLWTTPEELARLQDPSATPKVIAETLNLGDLDGASLQRIVDFIQMKDLSPQQACANVLLEHAVTD